uniref:Homeobox domain-containing protein n=1 Tax=Timema bartmani TaxID=61472 RepID=A0A7R9ENU5_9NEOP|nr:unnamed protein product [Timema bartmani]
MLCRAKAKELSSKKDKALNWFGNVRQKMICSSLCEEDQVKVLERTATGRSWFSKRRSNAWNTVAGKTLLDSLLRTTLKTENPEYPQMEFTQNEREQERRERATDILGSPNFYCRSQNGEKSSLFDNIDVDVVDASEPFTTVCEDRTESSRPMPQSWSNNDGTGPKNTPLTKKQLMCLRRAFKADPAPKQESYTVLAKELGLSATNVWHWFFYERYKIKTKRKIARKNSPYLFPNNKQLETLNKSFLKDNNPSKKSIQMLSKKLRLKQITVCNWFSNMRRGAQFLPEGECASNSEISNTRDSILCELPDRSNARKKLGLNRSQVENLNKECSENNRPSREHMQELAKQLNIPFRKVYLWFYDGKGKGENKNCNRFRNKKTNGFSSLKEPNIHQDIRRKRNLLSLKQLSILKVEFVVNCYPSKERRKLLSTQLGLRERSVFNWFSRVRRKMLRAELSINNKAARQRILATISTKNKQKDNQQECQIKTDSDLGEYTNKDHSHGQLKEPYQSQFKTCRQTEETRRTNQSGDRHKSQVKKCSRGLNKLKNHKHPMVIKGSMSFLYSHQLSRLKEEFVGNGYLPKQGRERVARELGLDKMKVRKWFSDARRKMTCARLNVNKREHREKIVMSYRNRSQILRVQPSWLTTRSVKLAAAPTNSANDETYDNT